MRKSVIVVSVAAVLSFAVASCAALQTPAAKQAEGTAAEAACQTVIAYAGTSDEEALCAAAPELVALANDIRAERADAGITKKLARLGPAPANCQIIPTQTVCATDDELFMGIVAVRNARPAHAGGVQ
jgi:hypothetical protein